MKKFLFKSIALFSLAILFSFAAQAQTHYGTACEGDACDGFSNSIVVLDPGCEFGETSMNFQVEIAPHSLCPNHDGRVDIIVCGSLIASVPVYAGDLPFLVPFSVPCHCMIEVVVSLIPNGEPITCKRLGYVTASLSTF